MKRIENISFFNTSSSSTLKETFTVKYSDVLPRTSQARPKPEIYIPKRDDVHPLPFHMEVHPLPPPPPPQAYRPAMQISSKETHLVAYLVRDKYHAT